MISRAVLLLLLLPILAACAQIVPPQRPAPSAGRSQLLAELGRCGAADGVACARIHLALAKSYLEQAPLTATSIDNAGRELQLAAQNPELAAEVRPWQNLIAYARSLPRRSPVCPPAETSKVPRAVTAPAQSAAEASAAERLQRLEQLLHRQAQESLGTKAPR